MGEALNVRRTPEAVEGYREHVARLIRTLSETNGALAVLTDGQVDAVLDPNTAAPILLSHAQEVLTRSEARYRDLITRAPSIVCELSPGGRVTLVNEAIRTMLGWEPESFTGRNFWDVLIEESDRGCVADLLRILRRRDVTGHELPVKRRDGRRCWIAWNSANRYTDDGALRSLVLFGVDVTDRREVEESNRRLAEAEMARTKAEAANMAKMDFLAVMSHELRTPLNAIGGYTQLLELGIRGPVNEEQIADLQSIRRSQAHLLGLINDIMNFVRLETGRVVFHKQQYKVKDLLDTIEALTGPQILTGDLHYVVSECDETLAVWGDREKIQQILINLVSNAIKFTGSGGHITVHCARAADDVLIRISDTGKGIPREKLAEIFDPFVQVNPKYSRPQDGVGLGLAISRDQPRSGARHGRRPGGGKRGGRGVDVHAEVADRRGGLRLGARC